MKLIVGLGNPGKKYANTRHNVGFMAIDRCAVAHESTCIELPKFFSEGVVIKIGRENVLLLKPQTFYNDSGTAVQAALHFYKLTAADLLVIHDDLDLPVGKKRISFDSQAAGNNGVASIITTLRTKKFARVRIGISSELREKMEAADYVTSPLTAAEKKALGSVLDDACKIITDFVKTAPDIIKVQNKYNGA